MFHGDIIRIGIEEENTERKRKVFPLTLKPHKLPAPACSSVITDAPNRTQKQVPLCPLCHPSVASMTSGQTGRSPSIPKRASSLELPAWTSPSVYPAGYNDYTINVWDVLKGSPVTSCLNMKTMLILYEFPLMGLPFAQDHEIIPSESGLDHSAHRYLGKEFEIITCK